MSLKVFHIVFIVLSMTLTLWFGMWAMSDSAAGSSMAAIRSWGIVSFACAAGLLVYGVGFFKKLAKLKLN